MRFPFLTALLIVCVTIASTSMALPVQEQGLVSNIVSRAPSNNALENLLRALAKEIGSIIKAVTTAQLPRPWYKKNPFYSWNWFLFGKQKGKGRPMRKPFTTGNTVSWKTFKANGVNLGGWMEVEAGQVPSIFSLAPGSPDEWTLCQNLGSNCGPAFEAHYGSWYNRSTIDTLGKYGINTLRVPTTYAAWIDYPGSQLYHGNQKKYLEDVLDYAASRWNMKVIIGLHSLPGGVNSLDIGEAFGHKAWFYNTTNFDYSLLAVNETLKWIRARPQSAAFSLSPLNEAGDDLSKFGSPDTLSDPAAAWVATYFKSVLASIAKISPSTTMVLQDNFMGGTYWASLFDASSNIVIDTHIYYFAASGIYSQYVAPAICGQAAGSGNSKFPTFIGEWSLQTTYNNTLSNRKTLLQTQQYAFAKYLAGGAFWSARFEGHNPVDGEGDQGDYWFYLKFIQEGLVNVGGALDSVYCTS